MGDKRVQTGGAAVAAGGERCISHCVETFRIAAGNRWFASARQLELIESGARVTQEGHAFASGRHVLSPGAAADAATAAAVCEAQVKHLAAAVHVGVVAAPLSGAVESRLLAGRSRQHRAVHAERGEVPLRPCSRRLRVIRYRAGNRTRLGQRYVLVQFDQLSEVLAGSRAGS